MTSCTLLACFTQYQRSNQKQMTKRKIKGEANNTCTDSLSIVEEEEPSIQSCKKRRLEITQSESIIQSSVSSNDINSSQQPSCFQHQEDSSQRQPVSFQTQPSTNQKNSRRQKKNKKNKKKRVQKMIEVSI